jgi:membrane-bound metal-dependent hydrolase YbcI (DUF457 family)
MANFNTHLMGAAAVSGLAATGLVMTGVVSHQAVASYFVLGVIGGLLPDIDSPSSIPIRVTFNGLALSAGFMAVFAFGQRYSLAELVLLWSSCFLAVRYGIFSLFVQFTAHRGLIHSIPAGAAFGLLTTLLAYRLFGVSTLHAWNCGLFLFTGFLIHLLLDEIYGVNLFGMELRSSFGSAFSLGSMENPLGTVALYLAIMVLFYLSPPLDSFASLMLNTHTYRPVVDRLLPSRGWFNGLFSTLLARL